MESGLRLLRTVGLIAAIALLALLPGRNGDPAAGGSGHGPFQGALVAFDSCERLRDHVLAAPPPPDSGFLLLFSGTDATPLTGDTSASGPVRQTSAEGVAARGSAPTGTNVQERGIDEPDLAKLSGAGEDGEPVFLALSGRTLVAVEPGDGRPALLGELDLRRTDTRGGELLVAGGRALILGSRHDRRGPLTTIAEVDVSDPAAMRVLRTEEIEGAYVSARLNGAVARVVVSSAPRQPIPLGGPDGAGTPQVAATIEGEELLPEATLTDRATGTVERRKLVRCEGVRRPREHSGSSLLTVLTIDLEQGLPAADTDTLMTDGRIVYGAEEALYIATERWFGPIAADVALPGRFAAPSEREAATEIHKFAIEGDRTEHVASGEVPGYMLSQWSMSEHEGVLRVASTLEPGPGRQGQRRPSESVLTTLAERDDELVEQGRVEGLGVDERIFAVRFFGDLGFVVTFREIDPLYALDLSDPSDPRVAGELKIPGFSSYLHPVGEDLLLGVGQQADRRGRTEGVQLSLFDVADPAEPTRTDRLLVDRGSWSPVQNEHRAFTYSPEDELAFVPIQSRGLTAGIGAFAAGPSRPLAERARLNAGDRGITQAGRTIVHGRHVYVFGPAGVRAYERAGLRRSGTLELRG